MDKQQKQRGMVLPHWLGLRDWCAAEGVLDTLNNRLESWLPWSEGRRDNRQLAGRHSCLSVSLVHQAALSQGLSRTVTYILIKRKETHNSV